MRPTAISGVQPDGLGCGGSCGGNCGCGHQGATDSQKLWGGVAIVNAVLLAGAVYGVWKLVQYLDREA